MKKKVKKTTVKKSTKPRGASRRQKAEDRGQRTDTKKSGDKRVEKLKKELAYLQVELADTKETLRAIQSGEVDALVVTRDQGQQVFTLQGAEHPYRVVI